MRRLRGFEFTDSIAATDPQPRLFSQFNHDSTRSSILMVFNCPKASYIVSGPGTTNNATTIINESIIETLLQDYGALILNAGSTCGSIESNSIPHDFCCPDFQGMYLLNAGSLSLKIKTIEKIYQHSEVLFTLGKSKAEEAMKFLVEKVLIKIDIDPYTSLSICTFFDGSRRIWLASSHPTHLLRRETGDLLLGYIFGIELTKVIRAKIAISSSGHVDTESTWKRRVDEFYQAAFEVFYC